MSKKFLNDFHLPDEGDIIDRVANEQEFLSKQKKIQKNSVYGDEAGELKAKTDFFVLINFFNQKVKRNGLGYLTECPVCKHNPPSLIISNKTKRYRCAKCDENGDMIDYIKHIKKIDFKKALKLLRNLLYEQEQKKEIKKKKDKESDLSPEETIKELGNLKKKLNGNKADNELSPENASLNKAGQPDSKEDQTGKADKTASVMDLVISPEPQNENETDSRQKVINEVIGSYHRTLMSSREAYARMDNLHIKKNDLISRFKYGFCDNSTPDKVSAKQLQILAEAGLITDNGEEYFCHDIIIPIFAEDEITVKALVPVTADNKKKTVYFTDEKNLLFNSKALKVYDEIILTESVYTALLLIKLGFENTVSFNIPFKELTENHFKALREQRVKNIYFPLSSHKTKEAETLQILPLHQGLSVSLLYSPKKQDWIKYLVSDPDPEKLKKHIASTDLVSKPEQQQAGKPKDRLKYTKQGVKDIFEIEGITYRLEGVKDMFIGSLRVNVKIEYGEKKYIDDVNLSSARSRKGFSLGAAEKLDLEPRVIEGNLLEMLEYLEEKRDRQLEEQGDTGSTYKLTEEEKELGMKFLTDPDMFDLIARHIELLGYTGENINKLLVYIAASTRKMDDPISVLVQAQSASGKSMLVNTLRKLMPEEDVIALNSLSDQALIYLAANGLLHKLLILGESVHSDIIDHQIREMLSSHELSRLVASKDQKTGNILSRHIKIPVIVSAMMTSTDDNINPENASRYFVINTDESRTQTERIHKIQKLKYSQVRYKQKTSDMPEIIKMHKSAQRLLKKVVIFNNYAGLIDFPITGMRSRRDHDRFNDLIAGICFLRQYQKEIKTGVNAVTNEKFNYIECDLKDYEIARQIAFHILPSTMTSLPAQARTLYGHIRKLARARAKEEGAAPEEIELRQREIRESGKLDQNFVKRFIRVLVEYEYLKMAGSGSRGSYYQYKLVKDEPIKTADLNILPAVEELKRRMENQK